VIGSQYTKSTRQFIQLCGFVFVEKTTYIPPIYSDESPTDSLVGHHRVKLISKRELGLILCDS